MFCDQLAFPQAQVEVLSLQAAVWQLPRWLAVPTPCRRVSQRRGRPPGPALPGLAELRWPGGDRQSFGNTRTGQPGACMQGLAGWASRGHRDVRFLLPTGNLQSVFCNPCAPRATLALASFSSSPCDSLRNSGPRTENTAYELYVEFGLFSWKAETQVQLT